MNRRKWIWGAGAAALAVGLAAVLQAAGLAVRWEGSLSDWRARWLARPSEATAQVKLILVDQSSLDWAAKEMGWSWPWPREVYGVILDYLQRADARAVAFDVLFTEPSAYGVDDDRALGEAITRFPHFVGAVFLGKQAAQTSVWPDEIAHNPLHVDGLSEWLAMHPVSALSENVQGAAFPVTEVASGGRWFGNVRETPDSDGIFRKSAPLRVWANGLLPSLGLACALAGESEPVAGGIDGERLRLAGRSPIPLDAEGRMILRFRGPSGTHEAYTAAAVIQSELCLREGRHPPIAEPNPFCGAYVIFGFSAPGLKDLRPTPMGGDYPGPELYATQVDNWLAGDFLKPVSSCLTWVWTVLLALGIAWGAVDAKNGWRNGAMVLLAVGLPLAMGFGGWALASCSWPMALPLTAALPALCFGAMANFLLEGRQKRFLKGAFKHYLSPQVIDQLLQNPNRLRLGGEQREVSVFFSDLQGFSGISERLSPEELTRLLNDYLTDMTDIILEEGGTLDKYEGDAIIAFWGAPLEQPDHAQRAVRAAVRCQRKLAERRDEFRSRTGAELRMRIGVNSGPVVVGNMGSSRRFDYTILGDAANLASRLEGANKALGTYLMISEATWKQTKDLFPGRELGMLRVVGRKTPVCVFEATGLPGDVPPPFARPYEAALDLLRHGAWADAEKAFSALGDEPAARTHAERCARLVADHADASAWDGIWNLTQK